METRLKAVESQMRELIKTSRTTLDTAKAEERELTAEEQDGIKSRISALEALKSERDSLLEAGEDAAGIRARIGGASKGGWKAVAEGFVKAREAGRRDHVIDARLIDIHGKGAEVDDLLDAATRTEAGIRPLLEDGRKFSALLRTSDPGDALHLEHFSIDARGLAAGSSYGTGDGESGSMSVERSPLSTEPKAEADVSVGQDSVDIRQFAITSGMIPNAAFKSVGALRGIIEASLGRELDKALDQHALQALADASPSAVSGGSGIVAKLRYAKADLVSAGVAGPYIAVIGDEDAVTIDLTVAEDMPAAFPFGMAIAVLPGIDAGDGFVMSQSAMTLHKGAARLDADPFTGFNTNETNIRLEYEALAVVDEPSAIISLGGGS